MTSKHIIKLTQINVFFENDNKTVRKGENAMESGHIKRMQFDAGLWHIKGEVLASMKNTTYKVEANFNEGGDITSAQCSCPRGIKCHHIAALLLFAYHNVSVTDKECVWNAPKSTSDVIQTAEEMYPAKEYAPLHRELSEDEVRELKEKLESFGMTVGFTWLLQEEQTQTVEELIPSIDSLIASDLFHEAPDKEQFIKNQCAVTPEKIKQVANATIGQRENATWFMLRKHRLTASNFGLILHAIEKNKFPPSLFKTLYGAYNLDGIRAIQWGTIHERTAIEQFEMQCNLKVTPTGLWLHESGVLGASPDGLVGEEAVTEVKCPYSYRNDLLSEKLKNNTSYIVSINDNNEIVVNEHHNYYHQIQGILHILNRKTCYLVIWTLKEILIVIIGKDDKWAQRLQQLENFYYNVYLKQTVQL